MKPAAEIETDAPSIHGQEQILTPEALEFLAGLHRRFEGERQRLLAKRSQRQTAIDAGEDPAFLDATAAVRAGDWQVAPIPDDLQDRRVEITGPVQAKMIINALNSGAKVFMADFEDSSTPNWENTIAGQIHLRDAVAGTLSLTDERGKHYALRKDAPLATLVVRPRGWHLDEKHLTLEGQPLSGALVDFGLYYFHNAKALRAKGTGPYFYLPKLESHEEARLWNAVFEQAQQALDLPRGTIKVTVLIETILAAFEMDEILYELRDHAAGLNAGRWDYIFSAIKKFRKRPEVVFPDRDQVTMTVPFMRAYTDLLVKTCHRRGAHAMGGMAAFIPSRRDEDINRRAFAKVRADKEREAAAGFDGTWVAHPDLVPVAQAVFDGVLGDAPHQKGVLREDVEVTARDLLDFQVPEGRITEAGLRNNLKVGVLYLNSWLQGNGAAAIHNLMEDAATAEIARSQLWQWLHHDDARLDDGRAVDEALLRALLTEEMQELERELGRDAFAAGRYENARALLEGLVFTDQFEEFLTLGAYGQLD